jgi:hypothetical protein
LLLTRRDLDVVILRQPGTLYATAAGSDLTNFYQVQALNRTRHDTAFTIDVTRPRGGRILPLGAIDRVAAYGLLEGRLVLQLPVEAITGPSTPVTFAIRTDHGVVQTIESTFLGPAIAGTSAQRE